MSASYIGYSISRAVVRGGEMSCAAETARREQRDPAQAGADTASVSVEQERGERGVVRIGHGRSGAWSRCCEAGRGGVAELTDMTGRGDGMPIAAAGERHDQDDGNAGTSTG